MNTGEAEEVTRVDALMAKIAEGEFLATKSPCGDGTRQEDVDQALDGVTENLEAARNAFAGNDLATLRLSITEIQGWASIAARNLRSEVEGAAEDLPLRTNSLCDALTEFYDNLATERGTAAGEKRCARFEAILVTHGIIPPRAE